jgi:hypothetical protein
MMWIKKMEREVMKKMFAVFLFVSGLGLLAAQEPPVPSGFIREVTGTVEIQTPGSSGWVSARAGMAVEKTARISTGFKSTAMITLGNAAITVRPLTLLTVEEIAGQRGTEQAGLFLRAGRVRAEVSPRERRTINFTVRSPVVTASVRGTAFEFDTVNIWADEGRVQYTSVNGSRVLVRAGERSTVNEKTHIVSPPREEMILALRRPSLPPGSEAGGRLNGDGPAVITGGNTELIITGGW